MKTKDKKKKEAEERQSKYDSLSPEQKLSKLDQLFGKGMGAKKEREKLKKIE